MGSKKQWLVEKPARGREMVTKNVAGQGKAGNLRMHEGYVGSQKYMVPDEDLMVMKELVDYKLGKKPDDKYVRDYEYAPEREADEKLRKMSNRLRRIPSPDDTDISEEKEEEPPRKDSRKIRFEDTMESADSDTTTTTTTTATTATSDKTTDDSKTGEKKQEDEESRKTGGSSTSGGSETSTSTAGTSRTTDSKSSKNDSKGSRRTKGSKSSRKKAKDDDSKSSKATVSTIEDTESKIDDGSEYGKPISAIQPKTSSETDEGSKGARNTLPFDILTSYGDRIRFLLSGHIRNDLKPIFIFHQFNGKSPFGDQKDFSSIKKEGNVDLLISGKFYKDSILEEVNNKLESLNIKPEKIKIDDRSKVVEESFYELLHVGKTDVDFQGQFLKQLDTKKYTPLLAFNVQNYPGSKTSSRNYETKSPPAVVYIAKPESKSIFEQKQEKEIAVENREHKHKRVEKREVSWTTKPEDDISEYEPHLKKNLSRQVSERAPTRRGRELPRDAGDVASDRLLIYNCDVHRRRSSKDKNILQRISQMFFSKS